MLQPAQTAAPGAHRTRPDRTRLKGSRSRVGTTPHVGEAPSRDGIVGWHSCRDAGRAGRVVAEGGADRWDGTAGAVGTVARGDGKAPRTPISAAW